MNKPAFTIVELLIVIGTIGILGGMVMTAVNPSQQIIATNDVKRAYGEKAVRDAVELFRIETGRLPSSNISVNPLQICRRDVDEVAHLCINLFSLVRQGYLTAVPVDVMASTFMESGFTISQAPDGRINVTSKYKSPPTTAEVPPPPPPLPDRLEDFSFYRNDPDLYSLYYPTPWGPPLEDNILQTRNATLVGTAFALPESLADSNDLIGGKLHVATDIWSMSSGSMGGCRIFSNPKFVTLGNRTFVFSQWAMGSFATGRFFGDVYTTFEEPADGEPRCFVLTLQRHVCVLGVNDCGAPHDEAALLDLLRRLAEGFASPPAES